MGCGRCSSRCRHGRDIHQRFGRIERGQLRDHLPSRRPRPRELADLGPRARSLSRPGVASAQTRAQPGGGWGRRQAIPRPGRTRAARRPCEYVSTGRGVPGVVEACPVRTRTPSVRWSKPTSRSRWTLAPRFGPRPRSATSSCWTMVATLWSPCAGSVASGSLRPCAPCSARGRNPGHTRSGVGRASAHPCRAHARPFALADGSVRTP